MTGRSGKDMVWMHLREVVLWTFAILGTGWGAAMYYVSRDVQRIDQKGSEATMKLADRVTILETEQRVTLNQIRQDVAEIKNIIAEHVRLKTSASQNDPPFDLDDWSTYLYRVGIPQGG